MVRWRPTPSSSKLCKVRYKTSQYRSKRRRHESADVSSVLTVRSHYNQEVYNIEQQRCYDINLQKLEHKYSQFVCRNTQTAGTNTTVTLPDEQEQNIETQIQECCTLFTDTKQNT
jgi:hypothetical protein